MKKSGGLFKKLSNVGSANSQQASRAGQHKKKEEPAPELTPLEKLLLNAGPVREDGSDKFFGLENFGNTCYCNSIVQALYYSEPFRDNVLKYPPYSPSSTPNGLRPKVNVQVRPPVDTNGSSSEKGKGGVIQGQGLRPEDKPDSPEYKKKQAMLKGPVLELAQENTDAYGMGENTFTALKDIFLALTESEKRTGVLSPKRFLELFKQQNELFRNSQHQDAHEFYGIVLNDVISTVEANARRMLAQQEAGAKEGLVQSVQTALGASDPVGRALAAGTMSPGTGWVHDIFEGVLTSETRCLTCERASQRDETFLDLSIDLEEHSSVTSCLRKFSDEEMLCERNKFHCDHCGGLQEAEKRMKIKRLPKVMALHLKRFKYTEDYSRLQKLFHRTVYPYQLRMFNTTDSVDDPDRLYELYAVVVHIGGNAYHGHYVSIIKTPDRGWLLFDDEMVEPVDKHFVRNFFGDKPGQACAYVLFYQETTFEKVQAEQEADGLMDVKLAVETAEMAQDGSTKANGHSGPPLARATTHSGPAEDHDTSALAHAQTAPDMAVSPTETVPVDDPATTATPAPGIPALSRIESAKATRKSKEEKAKEKQEIKAQLKVRKAAEKDRIKDDERRRKEAEKQRNDRLAAQREARRDEEERLRRAIMQSKETAADEEKTRKKDAEGDGPRAVPKAEVNNSASFLKRSLTRKSLSFLKGRNRGDSGDSSTGEAASNGTGPSAPQTSDKAEKNGRFSFGLGRKKSSAVLS